MREYISSSPQLEPVRSLVLFVLAGLILIIFPLCGVNAQEKYDGKEYHKLAYENQDKIKAKIQESVSDIISGEAVEIEGEYIFSSLVLPQFYANRDYMPAWDNWEALMDAIVAIQGSYHDGLNPTDYHGDALIMITDKIEQKLDEGDLDYDWVAEFDILITDAILMYAFHLIEGKVDPESLDADWNYTFHEISPEAPYKLEKGIETASLSKVLQKLRPQLPAYSMQMDLLASYRVIADNGGWGTVQAGGAIKPANEDKRIPAIRERLYITGELSSDANMQSITYDTVLEKDIVRFQARNALTPDGIIGKGSFEALNVSVEKRINTLRVNLERNRWINANLSNEFVIVNIAAFKAYYIKAYELIFSTNVQVGKTFHKTPVFKERLRYIEFNPTWTVPVSIIRSSIIPKMKEDPEYLTNHHFELLDGAGNIIPNSAVDYDNLSSSNFSYSVRQKAGPWNALGEVKFIFPNKHAVYLHDTPSKSLFSRQDRAFSHGCIRTQNPLDLAEVLLKESEWTRQKIDETIETRKTTRAFFDRNIEILLLYWTSGYYDGDGIGFFKDIYDRDAKVLEELNEKNTRTTKDKKI